MAEENLVDEVVDTKVVTDNTDDATPETGTTAATSTAEVAERPAPVDWPSDWREKASGGDAKKLSRLSRYTSPQALADALIAAQNKISTGDLKVALGKDAKPEEVSAYRDAHGIPDTPEKYDLTGVEVSAEEKPLVDKFLVNAHTVNMTPEQVRASLDAYSKISEEAHNTRLANDEDAKGKAEDALRADWGNEYRSNLNLITNLLDGAPQGVREKLLHGRLSDGTPIGSSVEVLQFLANMARDRNPSGVVVPSGVATESAVQDEMTRIQKEMYNKQGPYYKGPVVTKEGRTDTVMAHRYNELLQHQERQRVRRVA